MEATKSATFDLGNPHLVLLVDDPDEIDLPRPAPTRRRRSWTA